MIFFIDNIFVNFGSIFQHTVSPMDANCSYIM